MGDRTFSAEDVIRIYENFLTPSEQETVDFFFMEEPEPLPPMVDFNDIRRLQALNNQLRTPLPGLFGLVLRFVPFAATLVSTIQFAAEQSRILINELLNLEGVDA